MCLSLKGHVKLGSLSRLEVLGAGSPGSSSTAQEDLLPFGKPGELAVEQAHLEEETQVASLLTAAL